MGSEIFCSFAWLFPANPHCLLTYSYKVYAGRVYICCSVNIKATIKANRVITVTAIAGKSYYHSAC